MRHVSAMTDVTTRKLTDENKTHASVHKSGETEYPLERSRNANDPRMDFGLVVLKQFSVDASQQRYQCVDFYDVGRGYLVIANVVNANDADIDGSLISNTNGSLSLFCHVN